MRDIRFVHPKELGERRHTWCARGAITDDVGVPLERTWREGKVPAQLLLFEQAGPRAKLYFHPREVRAGIVTCGGLCPGLNNVIRSLYMELHHGYGVDEIYGFRWGYHGLDPRNGEEPVRLTQDLVDDIHTEGGTILGTSRGPVDLHVAVTYLAQLGTNVLFCVGGDGTQRGALALYREAERRGYQLAVVGIPKTIDNDIQYVDHTFGYLTAVEEARRVIESAHVEARSVRNGVSVVKLMGREAGFIACGATIASQDVNFCLIPEVAFTLEGDGGFLHALEERLARRRHAVIVVAEGAGQELMGGRSNEVDASGNRKLKDIGQFLCEQIRMYFAARGTPLMLRYFDPSYMIRSRPADSEDAQLCDRFARAAVHAAMAGKTAVVIGNIGGAFVHVPMELVVGAQKRVNPEGELWHAVLAATGQRCGRG